MNEKQTGNIVTNGINSRSLWAEAWLRFKRINSYLGIGFGYVQ